MKRYGGIERDKPFNFADRLSRLTEFDLRVQFSAESGVDGCLALVLFGHGLVLGFTRGLPHIVGGVYVGVSALTERIHFTFGFQSEWYDDYLNRIDGPAPVGIDIDSLVKGTGIVNVSTTPISAGECTEDCCSHEDVAECNDARLALGSVEFDRSILSLAVCQWHGPIQNCGNAHDDAAGLADDDNPQYISATVGEVQAGKVDDEGRIVTVKPCGIARHRDIGCSPDCPHRV